MSVQERYCARGERCKLYDPKVGKPQKLGIYHEDAVCDQCKRAESNAAFEAYRHATPLKYERVKEENPLKRRLRILKRNLVARMIAKRGGYWEAITEMRNRWHLDPVPTQLPPASEDILYPQSVPTQRPPRPSEYILPPDIPNPYMGEPGGLEEYENWLNLRADWLFDLGNVLRCGVPERYVDEEAPPYMGWAPPQERWLPWYRFAAACVLYNPPPEEASVFADYGGLPLLPAKGKKDEPTPSVLTEQHLREGRIDLRVQNALEKMISEKAWELRSELEDLDFRQARRQVWNRFQGEFEAALKRLRQEWYQREIELDPPPHYYYVKFDPLETTDKEVLNALKATRAREGYASKGGREANDELLPVTCALLLGEPPGRSAEQLAEQLGLSIKRVQALARDGQKFLQRDG